MRISRLFFVITILLAGLACIADNPLTSSSSSTIHLSIDLPQGEDPADTSGGLSKAVTITSATLTVTADDMDDIVESLTISGETASGTVDVPKGEARTFEVVLRDANGVARYQGSTTQDIEEKEETVTILALGLYSDVTVNVNILAKQLNPSVSTSSLSKSLVTTTAVLSVTASDITTIEEYLTVGYGGETASGTVEVPKGNDRTFEVLCKDASGVTQYSGSITQNILAATATVAITTEGHYPSASTLTVTDYDIYSVTLSWTQNTDVDFYAYELVRAGTAGDLTSPSTRETLVAPTDQSSTTYTDDSVSPNTTYHYAIIVWDTEGMGMRSASQEVRTPDYQLFSASGPWYLYQDTWTTRYFMNNSFAPSGATVTNVEYRLRITYYDDLVNFYCGDYEIYLSSSMSEGAVQDLLVYDNLGGWTDGDYDDDVEDDYDIYLNWRSTEYFNGENPNQYWGVYIVDTMIGDYGQLDYLEFIIQYETPAGSPGVVAISVPIRAADEDPSLDGSHPSVGGQGSIDPAGVGFDKIKSPAGR